MDTETANRELELEEVLLDELISEANELKGAKGHVKEYESLYFKIRRQRKKVETMRRKLYFIIENRFVKE